MIYPTYDWAHGQSDAIEGVTHSLCTLEFDSHRALYDWYLEHLPLPGDQPRQTEFARLELTHTVTSKRRLAQLVDDGIGRRAGTTRACPPCAACAAAATRPRPSASSAAYIGVSRTNSRHSIELLESFVRTRAQPRRRCAAWPCCDRCGSSSPTGPTTPTAARSSSIDDGGQQPGEPRRRHAPGAVLQGPVHRARRLHGGRAAEVLPPHARARGPAAVGATS